MKKIDLTGKIFGRLTVLEQAPTRISPGGAKMVYWRCKCICGNITEVNGNLLRRGETTSCGCYHREQQKKSPILQAKDMSGKVFGHLTVLQRVSSDDKKRARWLCQCDCGRTVIAVGAMLRCGHIRSCNANIHRQKYGGTYKKLYKLYSAMSQRCFNPNNSQFKDYGGRGITMCEEWRNNYNAFRKWALLSGYREETLPNGLNKWTIDRINVNGNYEPGNCRWITCQEQQLNKRDNVVITYKGETKTATEFAKQYNIPAHNLWYRLKHGWSVEAAIETPVKKRSVPKERPKIER